MSDDYNDDYYDCDEDKQHRGALLPRLTAKMDYFTYRSGKAFNQKCKDNDMFKNNENFKQLFNKKGSYVRDNYYELLQTMRTILYSQSNFLTVTKLISDTDSRKRNVMARIKNLDALKIINVNKNHKTDRHLNGVSLNKFGVGVLVTMDGICEEVLREFSSVNLQGPLIDLDTTLNAVISRFDYVE